MRNTVFALGLCAAVTVATVIAPGPVGAASGQPAGQKQPPACAAITFRAVEAGAPDGTQQAGLYRSRFGRMVLKAEVSGGTPVRYWMEFDGKPGEPHATAKPADAAKCLKEKNVSLPVQPVSGNCTGSRFRLVIDRSLKEPAAMLFGLDGNTWKHCSTMKV